MSTAKLTRREQRAQAQHFIDTLEGTAFPNSKRIYISGSQADIRVPMREIQLSPTLIGGSKDNPQYEDNEPCRCMTPPVLTAILMLPSTSSRVWRSCASLGLTRVTTAKS